MSPSPDEGAGRRSVRRPSALTVAGLVLLALGLGCLGWVAYEYVGSNVVADRRFDHERSDLRDRWTATPVPTPASPAPRPPPSVAPSPSDGAAALLRIPKFGADYEVPIVEGTDLDDLARGVGHYPGTAAPGAVGNFALAGHRVTHGEPFARLLDLDKGDQVIVETSSAIYTYVLDPAPRAAHPHDLPRPLPLPGPLRRLRPPDQHPEQVGS